MSAADILAVLDAQAADFDFPGFNNANCEFVDARMHLFRAGEEWGLLIEEAIDWPGAGGPMTALFGAGPLIAEGRAGLLDPFEAHLHGTIDDEGAIESATLRGKAIDLVPVHARAEEAGVEGGFALVIHLSETRRAELFHDVSELRAYLVPHAEHLLTIEAWCHPDVYGGPKPSESEVFTQVAEVLATGNVAAYAPTEAPNSSDWKFWLESK